MSQAKSKTPSSGGATKTAAKPASLARAVSLHLEGKLPEALDEINRTLQNGEGPFETYSAKAQIQFELGLFDDASKTYAKVLSMSPRVASANLNLAVCLDRLGRWQEAVEFFEKAAEAEPNRPDARLGLGISCLHLDKTEAAAECFNTIL